MAGEYIHSLVATDVGSGWTKTARDRRSCELRRHSSVQSTPDRSCDERVSGSPGNGSRQSGKVFIEISLLTFPHDTLASYRRTAWFPG